MNNVSLSLSKKWSQLKIADKEIYFRGYFYHKGKLFTEKQLNELIQIPYTSEFLQEIKGEFAFVYKDGQRAVAAVDRKRTIPLFYGKKHNEFFIKDQLSPEDVQGEVNDLSVSEFILTGYVAADRTLYQGLSQIEAGQLIIYEANQLKKEAYFRYYHTPKEITIEEAAAELAQRFKQTFDQMYKRINGKNVVIPLSGGYDSRIIALLLKEFGVENITTFTYGYPSSKEALRSKEIANRLGLDWSVFPYDKSKWYEWYRSSEWKSYQEFGTNLSSIAHIQDWPAVKTLLEKLNAEPHEYVFIPGHSGDFIAGSHIPYELTEDRSHTIDEIVQEIMKKHHRLWATNDSKVITAIQSSIKEQLNGLPFENREEASAAFEYWDWKERQGKFIINSLRVYEYYNQDWEIPLWDDLLVDFFLSIPVEYRYKKYLYDYTLNYMYPDYFEKPKNPVGTTTSFSNKYGPLYPVLKRLYNKKELYSRYHKDPMEWYGITGNYVNYLQSLSFHLKGSKYHTPYNINSILVKDYINNLKG
jgi:asparagine synthase (glutamine-hydrolysing)